MGRNFQTAPTQFVDDYIYQPPWELMQQAAAQKQQTYDLALASAKLFNKIPIEHLQGEDDVYNVKEKQRYYAENAANIAKAIQNDPAKAKQYMSNIEVLQSELEKDMTSGDLSHIIGSAQAYKKWQEDNKKLKEDEPYRYAAAEKAFLNDYINAGGNSISQRFKGDLVTKDIDYEGIRKSLGELKANKIKSTRQTPGGGLYMVETEKGLVEMSEQRMNEWMLSQVLTPENLASLSQSEKFGLGTYRNSERQIDYEKGTLFAPLRGFARAGQYSEQEGSFKVSANTAAIAEMNEAGQNNRFWAEMNYKKNKDAQDRIDAAVAADKTDKATRKAPLEAKLAEALIEGDNKAVAVYQAQIDAIDGKQGLTQTNLGSKYADTNALIAGSKGKDKIAQKHIDQTLPQALGKMGINYKDPKQKAIAEDIVGKVKQGKLNIEDIPDYLNKVIPIKIENISQSEIDKKAKEIAGAKMITTPFRAIVNGVSTLFGDDIPRAFHSSNVEQLERRIKSGKEDNSKLIPLLKAAKAEVAKQDRERNQTAYNTLNHDWTAYREQAKQELIETNKKYRDLNKNYRDSIQNKITEGFKEWEKNFAEKRDFSSTYEVTGFKPSTQASLASTLNNDNFAKEFSIETKDKNGKPTIVDYDKSGVKIIAIKGGTDKRGNGTNMYIGVDDKGKEYNIISNNESTLTRQFNNVAYAGVENKSTPFAMSLQYPTVGRLRQGIESAKLLGKPNITFPLQVGNNSYTIKADINNEITVIDKFGNSELGYIDKDKKIPKTANYLEAGMVLERLNNK